MLFLPWLDGSVAPKADTRMRGGFVNLSLDTRRTHLVRAVVEGICHNLALARSRSSRTSRASASDEIVFGGGAARSPVWAQILADVLDRPVRTAARSRPRRRPRRRAPRAPPCRRAHRATTWPAS